MVVFASLNSSQSLSTSPPNQIYTFYFSLSLENKKASKTNNSKNKNKPE